MSDTIAATEDQWQRWRDRLAGQDVTIEEQDPHSGYYRVRLRKDGPWLPVAIWRTDAGDLIARRGPDVVDAVDIWMLCAKNPISQDLAKHAFETGEWLDMPSDTPARSNMPSDPFEALKAEIDDRLEQARKWLKDHPSLDNQQDADMARNMEAQIQALQKRADEMHKAEKAPHLEAGRAVDQKFSFRKDAMEPVKKALKAAWGKFAAAEERRLRDEAEAKRRQAEEERRRLLEEQQKKADEDPIAAVLDEPPAMPEMPPPAEAVKVNVGGGVGSRGGLTTVWLAEIENYEIAAAHYANRTEVKAIIEKLASAEARALKEGAAVPGVRFYSERRAK